MVSKALLARPMSSEGLGECQDGVEDVIKQREKLMLMQVHEAFCRTSANEFNEESLFELNVDQDSKGGYGVFSSLRCHYHQWAYLPPYALGTMVRRTL